MGKGLRDNSRQAQGRGGSLWGARLRVLLNEPLVVGETRQPHFWWQILRLRWR